MVAPPPAPNVIAVAIAMIRKSCRVRAFITELSVGGPDARRDQTPGMPGAFPPRSRSAAIGARCQLVQVHEPSGNAAAFQTAVQHQRSCPHGYTLAYTKL